MDLLAPFGGIHRAWAHPPRDRGADAVQKRLNDWTSLPTDMSSDAIADDAADDSPDGAPGPSVLYWVGHGWSNGRLSALAHAHSPAVVGAAGVAPQQLAYALRSRRALLDAVFEGGDEDDWAMVVVDACRSSQVVDAITKALADEDAPPRVLVVAVTAEGATPLGRFTNALQNVLLDSFKADQRIPLRDLAAQLEQVLGDVNVYQRRLGNATADPKRPTLEGCADGYDPAP